MVTHVVLFELKDPSDAVELVQRLRSMEGRIPALQALEAGVEALPSERSAQVALITRHADEEALRAYAEDPIHGEVLAWIKPRVAWAKKVDFRS
jgi:hypothetical protein